MTTSPFRDALLQACQAWTGSGKYLRLQAALKKDPLLEQAREEGRYPSGEEESVIRDCLEGAHIPEYEWGAVCLLGERIRRGNAELELQDEASEQIAEAARFTRFTRDDFLRWPWKSLDGLVGGMAPGTLHFVVCPSKGGKTTLCRSASTEWMRAGKRVFYAGFEMTAAMLRTMYAADDIGINPGDVTSGEWLNFEHYGYLRERFDAAVKAQDAPNSPYQNLRFANFTHVTVPAVEKMLRQAADWGAKVVVVDHIDHVSADSRSEYSNAIKVCDVLDRGAKEHGLVVIATSQMNSTGKSQDLWRDHRPLRFEHVNFGAIKVRVATTMIGFRRPLRPEMKREDRQAVEAGEKQLSEFLWPGINAANLIDSRTYGERKGRQCFLGWEKGRIVDPPPSLMNEIQGATHGIKTARG